MKPKEHVKYLCTNVQKEPVKYGIQLNRNLKYQQEVESNLQKKPVELKRFIAYEVSHSQKKNYRF